MSTGKKVNGKLKREIGLPGAVLMGLGSIIGTGIFVSIAIATEIAGHGIILAVILAGILAAFNGLSSAQLAAAHPMSGGTYEYGYKFLNPYLGFAAGWMFLVAKSASAATAVLGCIAYIFFAFGWDSAYENTVLAGLALLLAMTILVSGGIKRSNRANKVIVGITLLGLMSLLVASWLVSGLPVEPIQNMHIDFSWRNTLYATALLFVAYTGYGRIATLGEEVKRPETTIPGAIITAMIIIVFLYLLVGLTAIHVMGADAFGKTVGGDSAPLMAVSRALSLPFIEVVVTIAAITAMMGVFLNLLLGLSRVALSMARRGDLPFALSGISPSSGSPNPAIWTVAIVIGLLIVSGNMVFTWTFSAFTVLIYYAITNLAALFIPHESRLYPKWVALAGLFGCVFLTLWIDPRIWIYGGAVLMAGLAGHFVKNVLRN
ncbi:MAG: amino acid permease [Saprospirales bacterium]|nr:MAG: amino acid permease [Saprospirales bacterium]